MTHAFPLAWPMGRPRAARRERSRFDTGFSKARDGLIAELERLGARDEVLSTNLALRLDGLPKSGQPQPDDPGVAVYFAYKGKPMCFACDNWDKVEHNIHAIAKTIEAMRGIARWGTGDMLDRAFSGFTALPAPSRAWREVLGIPPRHPRGEDVTREHIEAAYRRLARTRHPDAGGSDDAMAELNRAREQALAELKP